MLGRAGGLQMFGPSCVKDAEVTRSPCRALRARPLAAYQQHAKCLQRRSLGARRSDQGQYVFLAACNASTGQPSSLLPLWKGGFTRSARA
jgi:hypothetical protein